MPDQEKKVLDALDSALKETAVPESLQPENIQKMLEDSQKAKKSYSVSGRKFKWNRYYSYAAAAAAMLVLVIGIEVFTKGGMRQQFPDGSQVMKDQTVQEKESAEVKSEAKAAGASEEAAANPEEEKLAAAGDYEEVYDYIRTYQDALAETKRIEGGFISDLFSRIRGDAAKSESATESVGESTDSAAAGAPGYDVENESFSDTNVRTEGIGEADIVKTDGTYLYVLKENDTEIAVIDTRNEKMKQISTIKSREKGQISEFYVSGKQVFVLTTVYRSKLDEKGAELYVGPDMEMLVYNVEDITTPKLTDSITQSGFYKTSRFVDGYLYLFSEFYVEECRKDSFHSFIPLINGKLLPEDRIYLPENHAANQYTVVVSVKLDNPGEIVDQKAVLAENGQCYVSHNNIYIYEQAWNSVLFRADSTERKLSFTDASGSKMAEKNKTLIRRISYKNGRLTGAAQGKVDGRLKDSFSIDEYDGTLRVVTTIDGSSETENAVFVLDKDLKIIGKIKDIAKGEQVYSARFFGKTGYFVTFRQTDPLFSVDFSDPKNPKIIGSLKIPGFSEYLHPYGDGLLLGIGMDADEKSGVTNGAKLSMFDISDPSDVKEVHKYIIKDAYYSDIFHDYRAVLVDQKKNMIGFSAYGNDEMYYIFSYDKLNGFNVEMKEEVNGMNGYGTRGLYIGEMLYVVKGNTVESYRMGTFEKVDDLVV